MSKIPKHGLARYHHVQKNTQHLNHTTYSPNFFSLVRGLLCRIWTRKRSLFLSTKPRHLSFVDPYWSNATFISSCEWYRGLSVSSLPVLTSNTWYAETRSCWIRAKHVIKLFYHVTNKRGSYILMIPVHVTEKWEFYVLLIIIPCSWFVKVF